MIAKVNEVLEGESIDAILVELERCRVNTTNATLASLLIDVEGAFKNLRDAVKQRDLKKAEDAYSQFLWLRDEGKFAVEKWINVTGAVMDVLKADESVDVENPGELSDALNVYEKWMLSEYGNVLEVNGLDLKCRKQAVETLIEAMKKDDPELFSRSAELFSKLGFESAEKFARERAKPGFPIAMVVSAVAIIACACLAYLLLTGKVKISALRSKAAQETAPEEVSGITMIREDVTQIVEIYKSRRFTKVLRDAGEEIVKGVVGAEDNYNSHEFNLNLRTLEVALKSDVGRVRDLDEDSLVAIWRSDGRALFVLADGMGGHNAGEVASKLCCIEVARNCLKLLYGNFEERVIFEILGEAIYNAHMKIMEEASRDPAKRGMGTTVDVVYFDGSRIYVAHIGDGRVYLIDGGMRRLTKDHTAVQEYVDRYGMSEEEAKRYVSSSVITQAVGVGEIKPDYHVYEFVRGGVLLMCCDGLTDMVDENVIYGIVRSCENLEECADRLIAEANARGGLDNISVILAKEVLRGWDQN